MVRGTIGHQRLKCIPTLSHALARGVRARQRGTVARPSSTTGFDRSSARLVSETITLRWAWTRVGLPSGLINAQAKRFLLKHFGSHRVRRRGRGARTARGLRKRPAWRGVRWI